MITIGTALQFWLHSNYCCHCQWKASLMVLAGGVNCILLEEILRRCIVTLTVKQAIL